MLNVGKKMWPISALLGELVGVAGFEPAIPSSRTRERGVRVEAKSLFRFKASVSTRTLRKYLIQPNMGHLPAPPRNLLGALYAALRIETPTYKRCDGGAMYHQEKGEAFSATAPYLSLGGTEQSTRWRKPMGKEWRTNKKGRPEKRTKGLMKLKKERRRNASRRKSVRP